MYIKSVRLRNYRNYENQIIQFDKGMNIIIGDNGVERPIFLKLSICYQQPDRIELMKTEN